MKGLQPCLRLLVLLTVVTGFFYPLLLVLIGTVIMPHRSQGSFIIEEHSNLGSELIGQRFSNSRYFWSRPSAIDYNPLLARGSYLSPTSALLKEQVEARKSELSASNKIKQDFPLDLLFSSGSGIDPHISVEAALYQLPRVAQARQLDENQLRNTVVSHIEWRFLGFLGEPRINVLVLNRALDKMGKDHP